MKKKNFPSAKFRFNYFTDISSYGIADKSVQTTTTRIMANSDAKNNTKEFGKKDEKQFGFVIFFCQVDLGNGNIFLAYLDIGGK